MSDIYFKCQCGKCMAVDQQGVGLAVPCPDCGSENTVPAPDIAWECEGCAAELSAPRGMIGSRLQCLQCQTMLTVPRPALIDMLPLLPGLARRKIAEWIARRRPAAAVQPVPPDAAELRGAAPSENPVGQAQAGGSAVPSSGRAVCPACHNGNNAAAAFCCNCGQPLRAGAATEHMSDAPHKPVKLVVKRPPHAGHNLPPVISSPAFRRAGRARQLLARAAVLLVLAGAGAAGWSYRQSLTGWWAGARPQVMALLDRHNIYRPPASAPAPAVTAPPAVAATYTPSAPPPLTRPAERPAAASSAGERASAENAQLVEARSVLARQKDFLARREQRDVERRARTETIIALQAETAKYAGVEPGNFTTRDGTVYRDVRVSRVEPDGISVMHAGGAGKVWFREMPPDIAARYGYDAATAELYEKAGADTRAITAAIAEVERAREIAGAIRLLVDAMEQHPSAVNLQLGDEMLEKLLIVREQDLILEEFMAMVDTMPPAQASQALRQLLDKCPAASRRRQATRLLTDLERRVSGGV